MRRNAILLHIHDVKERQRHRKRHFVRDNVGNRELNSPHDVLCRVNANFTSVVFNDVFIEPGAKVKRAIIDKEAKIRAGTHIGYDLEADKSRGCTISDNGVVVVPRGMDIGLI